jgi:hypothetical protein
MLLVAFMVVPSLTSCDTASARNERLDHWADQLKIRTWGQVVIDDYAGSNNFSDTVPTLTLLMTGKSSTIEERAQRALVRSGFSLKGDEWYSIGEGEDRTVDIHALPGNVDFYLPGAKRTIRLSQPEVRVTLNVTSS